MIYTISFTQSCSKISRCLLNRSLIFWHCHCFQVIKCVHSLTPVVCLSVSPVRTFTRFLDYRTRSYLLLSLNLSSAVVCVASISKTLSKMRFSRSLCDPFLLFSATIFFSSPSSRFKSQRPGIHSWTTCRDAGDHSC